MRLTRARGGAARVARVTDAEMDPRPWSTGAGSSAPAVVKLGPREASVLCVEAVTRRTTMTRP